MFAATGEERAEPGSEPPLVASGPDESKPVTEAVPESSSASPLTGDSTIPADGTYATEAEAGSSPEKT
jgi:hypothetical protein